MGFDGSLPWPHNSEDMAHFKRLTSGHVVVMGSKTWNDPKMPKPLKDRTVYVATTKPTIYATPIKGNLYDEVIKIKNANPTKIIWVIGGAEILNQCRDLYDKIYLTHFKGSYKIDTRIDLKSLLSEYRMTNATANPNSNCTFVIYESIFKRQT
jgi:dihydrofolate reductase